MKAAKVAVPKVVVAAYVHAMHWASIWETMISKALLRVQLWHRWLMTS